MFHKKTKQECQENVSNIFFKNVKWERFTKVQSKNVLQKCHLI